MGYFDPDSLTKCQNLVQEHKECSYVMYGKNRECSCALKSNPCKFLDVPPTDVRGVSVYKRECEIVNVAIVFVRRKITFYKNTIIALVAVFLLIFRPVLFWIYAANRRFREGMYNLISNAETNKKILLLVVNAAHTFFLGEHWSCMLISMIASLNEIFGGLLQIPTGWMPDCISNPIEAMKNYFGAFGLKELISILHDIHVYAIFVNHFVMCCQNQQETWIHLAVATGHGILHIFLKQN